MPDQRRDQRRAGVAASERRLGGVADQHHSFPLDMHTHVDTGARSGTGTDALPVVPVASPAQARSGPQPWLPGRLPAWWQGAVVALLALAVVVACAWVATDVFDRTAHVEDEVAFLFQARVFASGELVADAPQASTSFWVPFVLARDGDWFGKYPPGWPALLGVGDALGAHWLVNPLAAGLVIVLVWLVGRRMYGDGRTSSTGLIAAALLATSPFLLLQGGSVMSHVTSQVMALLALLCFLRLVADADDEASGQRWGIALVALGCGAALGMLLLERSLTAVGIGLPLALWALARLVRQRGRNRAEWLRWGLVVLGFLPGVVLLLAWNHLTTGSVTSSAYELWWPYDRIGFGVGISRDGNYTLAEGLKNMRANLRELSHWLYGWPGRLSLLPAFVATVVALLAPLGRRLRQTSPAPAAQTAASGGTAWGWDLLLLGTVVSVVLVHLLYWTDGQMYGPRYYFETSAALALLSARGLQHLVRAGQWLLSRVAGVRGAASAAPLAVAAVVLLLSVQAAQGFTSDRFDQFRGWYDMNRDGVRAVERANLDHALVFVPLPIWTAYAPFFLEFAPDLNASVLYVADRGAVENREVLREFPGRSIYRYDLDAAQVLPWPDAN